MKFVEHEKEVPIIRYITKVIAALHYGRDLPEKPADMSWRDVFTHANTHSVAGTIWYMLEDVVSAEGDVELIRRWARERDLDFAKYINHKREFDSITREFTARGVKFLPMKGLIYRSLWARPEYRTMSDMDIYVPEEYFATAREIILSLGYTAEDEDRGIHNKYMKLPYVNIELHRQLEKADYISDEDMIPSEDNPCWLNLSLEDFIASNVSHVYKHYTHGGCGVRSIFDLRIFNEKYGDKLNNEIFTEKLKERGVYEFYLSMCELSDFWYGDGKVKGTDSIYREEYYIAGGATYGTVLNRVRFEAKTQGKIAYVFSRAFPSFEIMATIYPWLRKVPFLMPVAWVMRWFRALFNGRLGKEVGAIGNAEWKKGQNEEDN